MVDYEEILPVIEVSLVIQGEGKLMGRPSILIRTTGCPFRCSFGDSKCDTPYASYKAEKGTFTMEGIERIMLDNENVHHIVISGGEPSIHKRLMHQLNALFGDKYHMTVETAGYEYLEDFDLISLSPKLSNSVPKDAKLSGMHKRAQGRLIEMKQLIHGNYDYQIKFVIGCQADIAEALEFSKKLNADRDKIWLMPAGSNRSELSRTRPWLMDACAKMGLNYSDRLHIVGFNDKRNK